MVWIKIRVRLPKQEHPWQTGLFQLKPSQSDPETWRLSPSQGTKVGGEQVAQLRLQTNRDRPVCLGRLFTKLGGFCASQNWSPASRDPLYENFPGWCQGEVTAMVIRPIHRCERAHEGRNPIHGGMTITQEKHTKTIAIVWVWHNMAHMPMQLPVDRQVLDDSWGASFLEPLYSGNHPTKW